MLKKLSAKQKLILIGATALGAAVFLLGGSILNLVHNKLELYRLTNKRTQLDTQYEQLLAEKKLLEEQDPKYMEMLARTRYNMVKPGEIEFRLPHD